MNICSFCFGRQASSAWLCSTNTVAVFSKFDYGFQKNTIIKKVKSISCFYNICKVHWNSKFWYCYERKEFMWRSDSESFFEKLTVCLPVMVWCDLVYNILCVVWKSLIVIHALKVHLFWEGLKNMTKHSCCKKRNNWA